MELGSADESKATFSLADEDHTLANSVRFSLNQDPRVTFCGYSIPHPSDARVNIRVQTTGDPAKEVLKDALQDLMGMCQHVRTTFDKAVVDFRTSWLDCPPYGKCIDDIIPSKVPLGESFYDSVAPGRRYSLRQVIHPLKVAGRELGLVIDMTNTTHYYSPADWKKQGIKHVKIACKGRDSVPDNESVNNFVYEVTVVRDASRFHHLKDGTCSCGDYCPRVTFCGYSIPHPSDARVNIRVQTTGDPAKEVLKDALQDFMGMCQHVRTTFDKAVVDFRTSEDVKAMT